MLSVRDCPEILSDDYVSGKKVKFTSKTSDDQSYSMSVSTSEKSSDILGELNVKVKKNAATISAKLLTNAEPAAELKYDRTCPDGRRTNVTLTASRGKALAKAELRLSRFAVELDTDVLKLETAASASAAIAPANYAGFIVVGAKGLLSAGEDTFTKGRVAASLFDGHESEIMVEMEGKADAASLSYSHLVREGMSVAGKIRYQRDPHLAVADMGLAMKVDTATTLKGKFNTSGMAALSYIQMVSPNAKLIMSSSFEVAKLESVKFGLAITLE